MQIVWLTINSSWSHSSLALPLIHSACAGLTEWQWSRCDGIIKEDPASLAGKVCSHSPDLVCAPAYIFNLHILLDVLGRIKALRPMVLIAVGGPECLGNGGSQLLAQNEFIDYACQGEGEAFMPQLLTAISENIITEIPGVITRNFQAGHGPAPQVCANWAENPLPCEDIFFDFSKGFVQIETSRGCPNRCTFCTSAGTPVRYRSLDAVRQELHILAQHGIQKVRLLDRTFNAPPSRAVELLKIFRREFPDMNFHLEVNPCLLTPELQEEFSQAIPGQLHIEAGMQSMQEDVIKAIGRGNSCQQAISGLKFLCSLPNIVVHSDLISGLPEQTLDSLYSDVQRMGEIAPGEIQLEVLKILKGTQLENEARKLGICYSPSAPYDVMSTLWMNLSDLLESRYLSKIVDIYYNTESLQQAFRYCLKLPDFLRAFVNFCCCHGLDLGAAPALKKRFLWLYEFLQGQDAPEAMDELRIAWMREAFGAVGPAQDAKLCEIPVSSPAIQQLAEKYGVDMRDAKYYRLQCHHARQLFFVYHRGIAPNKAIAILPEA